MSTAAIIIVFIVAVVLTAGFLVLVLTLVPAINQLRLLMKNLEKTSDEVRNLTATLQEITEKVNNNVEKFDSIIDSSKRAMDVVSNSVTFLNRNFLKSSAGLVAILPAIKLGWRLMRKIKGGNHVK